MSELTHERYRGALGALAQDVATLRWSDLREDVVERTLLVLLDTLGVAAAGAATPELVALRDTWDPQSGPAPLIAGGLSTDEATACLFNGAATCCLELDEGSKYARGHPSAHVLPAALALGASRDTTGEAWLEAFLGGYEVAARFGRATKLRPGVHPHGTWGVTGAAAAGARLLSLKPEQLAGAIDAGVAQSLAPHFSSAFKGSFVRNAWIGASSFSGLTAARLAATGLAQVDGAGPDVLGEILGSFDADELDRDLGGRKEILGGYFKRHAACAYTHPAADAVQKLFAEGPIDREQISEITVETYAIAATLGAQVWPTRLAAMFSIPYVVAETARTGDFGPRATDEARRLDPETAALAGRVIVRATDEFESRLPAERGARVTIVTGAGARSVEVRNPIGDADNQPLGWAEVRAKVVGLTGTAAAAELEAIVRALPAAARAAEELNKLTSIEVER